MLPSIVTFCIRNINSLNYATVQRETDEMIVDSFAKMSDHVDFECETGSTEFIEV